MPNSLTRKLRKIAIASLLLLVAVQFAYIFYFEPPFGRRKKSVITQVADSSITVPVISRYTDSAGVEHAVIDAHVNAEISRQSAEFARKVEPILDSVARLANVKPSQVEGYASISFGATRDSVRFLTHTVDSLRRVTRSYRDKYLTLLVRDPVPEDTADKGNFDFAYNADLRTVDYSRKRKFLGLRIGKREYFTDISSSDPRLKIKGTERFTIQRRVPALGFRLQALTSYNLETRGQTLGLGVRFDVGDRFNTGVNYTYSFLLHDWLPTLYAKYDLLQFGR